MIRFRDGLDKEGVMPKESIHNGAPYEVQVGWQADGDVQLGVELSDVREDCPDFAALPDRRSLLWQLFGSTENLRRFGAEMIEMFLRAQTRALKDSSPADFSDLTTESKKNAACEQFAIEIIEKLHEDWRPTGIWSTLSRYECNRLIKTLRRARDAAYGRDE